jgi:hypothetical protein
MAAQGFVAKTAAKAKVNSETERPLVSKKWYYCTAWPEVGLPEAPGNLTRSSFCGQPIPTIQPATVPARFMPPYRGLKDKCIQTH